MTRSAVRDLSAGEAICEFGITFSRELSGDGVYSVNVMVDRRRIHRVIGRESEGVTRQQAEDFITRARADSRRDRLDLPDARKTPLGFCEAAERYLARLEQEGGKNIKTKRRQIAQHLTPFFGGRPLSHITSSEIEQFKKARRADHAAPATINRELAVLSHLLRCSLDWGWLKTAPARIRRFREANARIIYLTKAQCAALEHAATQDQNEDVHAFVMIGLRTGMRHSEILAISKEHVDLDHLRIWIPQAKAGAREQPITADLADYLRDRLKMLPAGSPWLFTSPARALS
jgi:integrase